MSKEPRLQNHGPEGFKSAEAVAKQELPLVQAVTKARALRRQGHTEAARTIYREALRQYPKAGPVYHDLGIMAAEEGKFDQAINFLDKALEQNPRDATLLGNTAEIYRRAERIDQAIETARKALEIFRVYPEACNTLGNALIAKGELDEARKVIERAIEYRPNFAEAHGTMGDLLRREGRLDEAAKSLKTALKHNPDFLAATVALAEVFYRQGKSKQAIEMIEGAIARSKGDIRLCTNLGVLHGKAGNNEKAIEILREITEKQPNFAQGFYNLGMAYLNDNRLELACEAYSRCFKLRRGEAKNPRQDLTDPSPPKVYTADRDKTSVAKLHHDIEQLKFLRNENFLDESYDEAIEAMERVRKEIEEEPCDSGIRLLTAQQKEKIRQFYNLAVYYRPPEEFQDGAVSPNIDFEEVQRRYFESGAGITYLDDLLRPEALDRLYRFTLESTIWYDYSYEGGYLGAYLNDGFACPLLFQIQRELREKLPGIFGNDFLRQMWGYKYDSSMTGIPLHADAAAVNVNFWVTPDSANRNSETGGLIVFDKEAPLDWDFDAYNRDQGKIKAFLSDCPGQNIPYRQNRAVIFNSNLFHRTADIDFKRGYENRRINITMLFGRRGHPN